jgi:hypothetical protein
MKISIRCFIVSEYMSDAKTKRRKEVSLYSFASPLRLCFKSRLNVTETSSQNVAYYPMSVLKIATKVCD